MKIVLRTMSSLYEYHNNIVRRNVRSLRSRRIICLRATRLRRLQVRLGHLGSKKRIGMDSLEP